MATKKKSESEPQNENLSFELAMANLEKIVESMEYGNLPLEDLVSSYEQGSLLLQHCESVLSSAKQRIELITLRNQFVDERSVPTRTSDSGDEEGVANSSKLTKHQDDDIRLF